MQTTPMPLGEKIRAVRKSKGLSQANIAHALNMSQPYVNLMERGHKNCRPEQLAIIRKFLDIENAPLLEHEAETFKDRLWIWHEMVVKDRLHEAKSMQEQLAPIMSLPYEHDLILLYTLVLALLQFKDKNTPDFKTKFEEAEAIYVPDEASAEARFLYHRCKAIRYYVDRDFKMHYSISCNYLR